jgi:RNA polymerase sigma factor (TIGR02999 family)
LILEACTGELYARIARFRVPISPRPGNQKSARKQKWLTKFNEFTGAKWPALLNDISQFRYTPVSRPVNRQFSRAQNPASWRVLPASFSIACGTIMPNLACVSDVTRILQAAQQGDPTAAEQLLPLVYEELRRLAARKMLQESPGQTLQPTALVHEAWLRLAGEGDRKWDGRAHFFGAAAEAMRRILIDRARRKRAIRHGGGQQRVEFSEVELADGEKEDQLLAINEALDKLAARDKVEAELVKLRYFAGLTHEEAAEILGIPSRTAKRYWTHARAWLFHEIKTASRSS